MANPSQKNTKLGALRIGQTVKKQIPLVNNSPSPITFHLTFTPTTPELQDRAVMKISPTQLITLPARGGTCKVDVVFSPKSRVQPFTEEVRIYFITIKCLVTKQLLYSFYLYNLY